MWLRLLLVFTAGQQATAGGQRAGERERGASLKKCRLRMGDWDFHQPPKYVAMAKFHGTGHIFSYYIRGHAMFMQQKLYGPVYIYTELEGTIPDLHSSLFILEYGRHNCYQQGDHYNPFDAEHGLAEDCTRHVGDLEKPKADERGRIHKVQWDPRISLMGPESVIGRNVALIMSRRYDGEDGSPQDSFNISCGTIGWAHNTTISNVFNYTTEDINDPEFYFDYEYTFVFTLILAYWLYYVIQRQHDKQQDKYKFEDKVIHDFHNERRVQLRLARTQGHPANFGRFVRPPPARASIDRSTVESISSTEQPALLP